MTPRPSRVRLRAYKVGFGDCLLLTVTYAKPLPDGRSERHVLIDCGTVKKADAGPALADIVAKMAEHCAGQLDVVVATHRHKDHISGFADRRARKTLDTFTPAAVIRPWTDAPESARGERGLGLDEAHLEFLRGIDKLPQQAQALAELAFDDGAVAKRARELVEMGLANAEAVALLEDWGGPDRARYVKAGDVVDLTDVLPGVKIRALGPPTLDQVPSLTRYAKESEEYWLGLAADEQLADHIEQADDPAAVQRAARVLGSPGGVGAAEWLVRQLASRRVTQGLEIVEALDDVLNNTSVILLITVGDRRILLPGDAQIENWSFTLDQSLADRRTREGTRLARELAQVDLYKVGHHGSRNATPKRLLTHWTDADGARRRVVSVLTTKSGVFGKSTEGAVPKAQLIDGLKQFGPVHSTDDLSADVWWMDLEAPAFGDHGFDFSPGEPV
ncbi:hypothetical protein AAFP30_15810 [Gordonia sp. CPCC 205515]|uniref:hypothetical protein n=1 Tax=Gordonia sp. CPCC 205515 TaxID=3140791 RepID=UPI003AF3AED4